MSVDRTGNVRVDQDVVHIEKLQDLSAARVAKYSKIPLEIFRLMD